MAFTEYKVVSVSGFDWTYWRAYSATLRCSGLGLLLYAKRKATTGVRLGNMNMVIQLSLPKRL